MPLDRVKLDPSLIVGIESEEKARVIVQAVVQLIKGVGCEIVAEAVENSGQADILRAMGVDTVQGFVFAARCAGSDSIGPSFNPQKKLHFAFDSRQMDY